MDDLFGLRFVCVSCIHYQHVHELLWFSYKTSSVTFWNILQNFTSFFKFLSHSAADIIQWTHHSLTLCSGNISLFAYFQIKLVCLHNKKLKILGEKMQLKKRSTLYLACSIKIYEEKTIFSRWLNRISSKNLSGKSDYLTKQFWLADLYKHLSLTLERCSFPHCFWQV